MERLETEILELTERYVDLEAQNVRLQEQISCFDELQEKVRYQYMWFIFALRPSDAYMRQQTAIFFLIQDARLM